MTDAITDSAGLSGPVTEKAAPRKRTVGSTAAKAAAESAPVAIDNVSVQESSSQEVDENGQKVITGPKSRKTVRNSNSFSNDENTIGSRAADSALSSKVDASPNETTEVEKVAVWSSKNIRWANVGTLVKGYNIVNKEDAEKWLSKVGIREATPEEVATHYGK